MKNPKKLQNIAKRITFQKVTLWHWLPVIILITIKRNNKIFRKVFFMNDLKIKNCKKSYVRVTEYEGNKIKQYCLRHHISKSRLIIKATLYCIENNISIDELFGITKVNNDSSASVSESEKNK